MGIFSLLLLVIGVVILAILLYEMDEVEGIKFEVNSDYQRLINICKNNQQILNWVATLNDRFEAFVRSNEFQVRKPYDKFKFVIPNNKYNIIAYIAVDKKLNLKFTVDFEPSRHDEGRSDKYLKYCVGYNCGLKEFIKKCEDEALKHGIEKSKVYRIEKIIND